MSTTIRTLWIRTNFLGIVDAERKGASAAHMKSGSTIPPRSVGALASPSWTGSKSWSDPCECGSVDDATVHRVGARLG